LAVDLTGYEFAKGISLNGALNKRSSRQISVAFLFAASSMRAANMAIPSTQVPVASIQRVRPPSMVSGLMVTPSTYRFRAPYPIRPRHHCEL
jgi:hypothetical protein